MSTTTGRIVRSMLGSFTSIGRGTGARSACPTIEVGKCYRYVAGPTATSEVIVLALTKTWLDYNTPRITGLALYGSEDGYVKAGMVIHPLAHILDPL